MEELKRIQIAAAIVLLVTAVGILVSLVVININWFAACIIVGYACIGIIAYTIYRIEKIKRGN